MCWRSGSIRAYHEPSDMFLLMYDPYDDGSGGSSQCEQEWADVFTTENHFQVQDAITQQWYSLSAYVFGHVRGRPLDLQMVQSKQNEGYWYSVADYLDYDETAFASAEEMPVDVAGSAADGEIQVEGEKEAGSEEAVVVDDESQSNDGDQGDSGDEGDTEDSEEEEEEDSEQESEGDED
ncbi:F-box/LRR-repeat protein 20 [Phytophthora cinnamomi]|uniref:F-box/LRR-repeat protein 20 n=1 Tax=Phytophthora cinnamomi TaxID=4785 RepID=UPI003559FCD1|nr:F-box/LRR-repeat protein 20 [Phytophthora cinnamomi]